MHIYLVPHIRSTKFNVQQQKHANECVDAPTNSFFTSLSNSTKELR